MVCYATALQRQVIRGEMMRLTAMIHLGLMRTLALQAGSPAVIGARQWLGHVRQRLSVASVQAGSTLVEAVREWGGKYKDEVREVAMIMQCAVRLCMEIEDLAIVARNGSQGGGTTASANAATAGAAVVKGDETPVTASDFAIQGFVSAALRRAYPEDRFMGEEDASQLRGESALLCRAHDMAKEMALQHGFELSMDEFLQAVDRGLEDKRHDERVWILDPIDGTKGLVTGQEYVIGLALVVDGESVLGCMGNPGNLLSIMVGCKGYGIRYWPYAGFGYMQDAATPDWQAVSYDYSRLAAESRGSWGGVGSIPKRAGIDYPPYLLSRPMSARSPMPFGPHAPPSPICCGSLIKYWHCAQGKVAGFIQFEASLKAWDHAAGVICVLESGGTCADASDNPIRFHDRTVEVDTAVLCCARAADIKARQLFKSCIVDSRCAS